MRSLTGPMMMSTLTTSQEETVLEKNQQILDSIKLLSKQENNIKKIQLLQKQSDTIKMNE